MAAVKARCEGCKSEFVAKSKAAKWCGETCRKRAGRAKASKATPAARKAAASASTRRKKSLFEAETERELRKLGKLNSMLGQQAMIYARRMANESEAASAIAALGREHTRIMEMLGAAKPPADEVEQARQAREAKLRAAGLA